MAALCVVAALLIMGFALKFSANQMVWGGVIVAVVVAIVAVAIVLNSSQREIKESLERTRKAKQSNPGE
jgi:membrane protein YdbS with pleckstrin-like domain